LFKIAKIYSKEVLINDINGIILMKKRPERRKHCLMTVVGRSLKFSRRRRPLSGEGAQDWQNLISYLHLQTQFVEDRCTHISTYRGNRPTNKQKNTQTDRTDYNTLRR